MFDNKNILDEHISEKKQSDDHHKKLRTICERSIQIIVKVYNNFVNL